MKILYDHQIFSLQRFGGISRYFSELISSYRFQPSFGVSPNLSLWINRNEHIRSVRENSWLDEKYPHSVKIPGKNRITHLLNVPNSLRNIKRNDFDIFHPTYYFDYFLDELDDKPFVLTVYDMIHEKFPDYLVRDPIRKTKPRVIEKAFKIIAISENTKRDIVSMIGIAPEKIEVIYLATNDSNSIVEKSVPIPDSDFILFVGNRDGYKNFKFFITSIAPFLYENRDIFLLCAGGGTFLKEESALIEESGLRNRIIQKEVSDSELKFLYKKARVFVFPSLYEGFGIPVLEAMTNQCMPLLANSSSLPEVGGDAAVYFNPTRSYDFLTSMETAWKDGPVRDKVLNLGKKRILDFSWHLTAERTANLYRSIV
ncbi:glycosyltransferase family 4 protein [Leptospira sp. WS92.C1]